ncbi:protein FAM149A [Bombina bombina]|uniref:protein FAM149A n=1 Tax=Bombina bombina TaxID=8345 RepID=UPI00235B2AD4|nr:protein FAM149A [Bombina bombina]
MKVAVLDLGTIFAKIFKSSVSPVNPGASNNPFSQGSHTGTSASTNNSFAQKASFLLLPAPASPLYILNSPTSSSSSLPRIPSGKALPSHISGLSTPSSPAHQIKPQHTNPVVSNTSVTPLQQQNEMSSASPQPRATSPATNLVRPSPSSTNLMSPTMQPINSSRSPRLHQDTSAPAWNTKSMLFTLPDIGEEATDYEESQYSQGKGLSLGNTNSCHSGNEGTALPEHFTGPVKEAIYNYRCESVSSTSSSGQTTPTELNNSWSGIQSYTTGLSTERSSVFSWRDDEFDKVNSQKVHQLFWDVDEMLFEGNVAAGTKNLQAECKEWNKRSLHLRVLGKQVIFPKDEGFQHFQCRTPSSPYTSSSSSLTDSSTDLKQLCISGMKLIPVTSPLQKSQDSNSNENSLFSDSTYSFLEEEIYETDGSIEEYLAYDCKEHDDEGLDQKKAQLHRKRNKRGIPPISPNDCIKDTVAAEVFDDVWRAVVDSLQELMLKSWEAAAEDGKQTQKIQALGNKYLQIPVPRIISETTSVPPSRGSEARSAAFGSYLFSAQANRNFLNDLNGVMTIQAKPLQQRHNGSVEKTQTEQDDKILSVVPSILTSMKNRFGRLPDNSALSASRALYTPARKTPTQRRLPSLAVDSLRSKTPNVYSDEVLRGTKMCTGLEHLTSPSVQITRNKLPPITLETSEQHLSVPGSRHSAHRGRYPHSRISSAVPDTIGRRPTREKTVTMEQFSRPNTTHTFRSEASHRRSFTPLDFANHTWTGQAFLTSSQYQPKSMQRNQPNSRRKFQTVS